MSYLVGQSVRAKRMFTVDMEPDARKGNVLEIVEKGDRGRIMDVRSTFLFVSFYGDASSDRNEVIVAFGVEDARNSLDAFKTEYAVGDDLTVKWPFHLDGVVDGKVNGGTMASLDEVISIVEVNFDSENPYRVNLMDRAPAGGEFEKWLSFKDLTLVIEEQTI